MSHSGPIHGIEHSSLAQSDKPTRLQGHTSSDVANVDSGCRVDPDLRTLSILVLFAIARADWEIMVLLLEVSFEKTKRTTVTKNATF